MTYVPEGHNEKINSCFIDYIDFDDSIGKCKVEIYNANENDTPHFHIYNEDNSFHVCICIYTNEYYKEKNIDKLSHDQCIKLNEWMKCRVERYSFDNTRWSSCTSAWEIVVDREDGIYPICYRNITQPNYEELS